MSNISEPSSSKPRRTPRTRVVASLWFAVSFFIPSLLYFLRTNWRFLEFAEFTLMVVIPTISAGAWGLLLYSRLILRSNSSPQVLIAAAIGLAVGLLTYLSVVLISAFYRTCESYSPGVQQYFRLAVYITIISIGILPLCLILGASSSVLAYFSRVLSFSSYPKKQSGR
jgi:hypothetical protein